MPVLKAKGDIRTMTHTHIYRDSRLNRPESVSLAHQLMLTCEVMNNTTVAVQHFLVLVAVVAVNLVPSVFPDHFQG